MRLDLRIVILLLVIIIAGLLALWKPWESATTDTITVNGEGTISAAPDQFVFYPTYQKKAASSKEAISQVSEVGNGVVTKLKGLGLADSDIKTSVQSGPGYDPVPLDSTSVSDSRPIPSSSNTATYSITAAAHTKEVAQKVLDYLVTTPVTYGISPQSSFSPNTKHKLEAEARQKGLADAHEKAVQTATSLGARLGKLKSASDVTQKGGPIMLEGKVAPAASSLDTATTPVLETGTEDLTFNVTVVYQIK